MSKVLNISRAIFCLGAFYQTQSHSEPSRAIDTSELECLISHKIEIPEVYKYLNRDSENVSAPVEKGKIQVIESCLKEDMKKTT